MFIHLPSSGISMTSVVPIFALAVSVVAMIISALTYYTNTIDVVRQRRMDGELDMYYYQTIILWEQTYTIVHAQARNFVVNPHLFPSMKENTKRLLFAMEKAVESGGLDKLLGVDSSGLDMYIAFIQALQRQADTHIESAV